MSRLPLFAGLWKAHGRNLFLLCATLACFLSPCTTAVLITDYTVTAVTASELRNLPPHHWAQYNSICDTSLGTLKIDPVGSLYRYFTNISSTGLWYPFYAWNSTPLYANGLGFLSPTWYGMCAEYCVNDFFAVIKGNYAFSSDDAVVYNGGGDWPIIGLYVAPFEMDSVNSTRSFIRTKDEVLTPKETDGAGSDGLAYTTVEYCNMPLQGTTTTAAAAAAAAGGDVAGLTAQVAVYTNGTIVMRYRTLPPEDALPQVVRSTGLIYSRTRRTVVATPTAANGIVAYRFEPTYDACGGAASAVACVAGGGGGADCVWCAATSACASRAVVADVCPSGQWTAEPGTPTSSAAQKFYNVTVDFNATQMADLSKIEGTYVSSPMQGQFFFQRVVELFKNSGRQYPSCIPGFSCSTQTTSYICNTLQNTCVNGDYNFALLALDSIFAYTNTATVTQSLLGLRQYGDVLCDLEGGCPAGRVVQVRGIGYKNGYTAYPEFAAQVYVDGEGRIDFVLWCTQCPPNAPFIAYPPIRVGLVRYGVADASSVLVPPGLLRSGVHLRFVPQTSCGDCGLHGSCDEATGRCGCVAGHYGAQCTACPVCVGGGVCDDGVNGSGACVCEGGACDAGCGGGADVHGRDCAGCNAAGGRCECGRCVCASGWSGAGCDTPPPDGCRAYSFDGCAVCGQHEGCAFCFDSTCYNTSLSGTATGYACSYSTTAANTRACRTYGSMYPLPAGVEDGFRLAVIWLIFLLILLVVLVYIILRLVGSLRRPRNLIEHGAVNTVVGIQNGHQDRSVMEVKMIRRRVPEAAITAIPLKQRSLRKLFQRRMQDHEKD